MLKQWRQSLEKARIIQIQSIKLITNSLNQYQRTSTAFTIAIVCFINCGWEIEINIEMEPESITGTTVDYDIIFIGPLAAVVANMLRGSTEKPIKGLIINGLTEYKDPSLLPSHDPLIKVQSINLKGFDNETGPIYRLIPEDNMIAMDNKLIYHYRFLVYTAEAEDWADYDMIRNLKAALSTPYSFVYSNLRKWTAPEEIAQSKFGKFLKEKPLRKDRATALFKKQYKKHMSLNRNQLQTLQNEENTHIIPCETTINLVFYIPTPPHRGYDNYNILFKLQQFTQELKNVENSRTQKLCCLSCIFNIFSISNQEDNERNNSACKKSKRKDQNQDACGPDCENSIACVLILEGSSLFPQDSQIDGQVQQYLREKGVIIIKGQKVSKIDYLRRTVHLADDREDGPELKRYISSPSNMIYGPSSEQRNSESKKSNTVTYDYFYTIIKERTPKLLHSAGINPFDNCPFSLHNNTYKNLYIFGADLFPTIHSFSAVNYQAHIISKNLQLKNSIYPHIQGVKKKVEYNGLSQFPFWVSGKRFVKFRYEYSTKVEEEFGLMCNYGVKLKSLKGKEIPNCSNVMNAEDNLNMMNHQNMRNTNNSYLLAVSSQQNSKMLSSKKEVVEKQELLDDGCCANWFNSVKRSCFLRIQINWFYNLKSFGRPFYLFTPENGEKCEFIKNPQLI